MIEETRPVFSWPGNPDRGILADLVQADMDKHFLDQCEVIAMESELQELQGELRHNVEAFERSAAAIAALRPKIEKAADSVLDGFLKNKLWERRPHNSRVRTALEIKVFVDLAPNGQWEASCVWNSEPDRRSMTGPSGLTPLLALSNLADHAKAHDLPIISDTISSILVDP